MTSFSVSPCMWFRLRCGWKPQYHSDWCTYLFLYNINFCWLSTWNWFSNFVCERVPNYILRLLFFFFSVQWEELSNRGEPNFRNLKLILNGIPAIHFSIELNLCSGRQDFPSRVFMGGSTSLILRYYCVAVVVGASAPTTTAFAFMHHFHPPQWTR